MAPMSPPGSEVIVVSGLPRTGTSMMMNMLHAGGLPVLTDHRRAPDDDNLRGYFEYEPVKSLRTDAGWLPDARGRAVKIIAMLLQHLPDTETYAILLMRRHLDEVIASQHRMLERSNRPGGRITDDQLRTLYQRQYDSAHAWAERPNARLLTVDYNALVHDPAPAVRAICSFLYHHPLDADAMSAIVEPDLYRQRQGGAA